MKYFLFLFLFPSILFAQNLHELKPLVSQTFVLNSRTAIGGANRVFIPILLPPGLIKLNYTISIRNSKLERKSTANLLTTLAGSTGYALELVKDQFTQPFADANADFWLVTSRPEAQKFKNELQFNYLENADNIHTLAQSNACLGNFKEIFLCFRNMHLTDGIVVEVQAVGETVAQTNTSTGISFCSAIGNFNVFLECEFGYKIGTIYGGNPACKCGEKRSKIFFVEPNRTYILVIVKPNGQIERQPVTIPFNNCLMFNLY